VSLDAEDLDIFTRLLGETTLPAIIKSANTVASRNKFLLALNHLLFDPEDSRAVGERDHLHRILEGELWIFGEGYNMMNSEKGLTQVLHTHLRLCPFMGYLPVTLGDQRLRDPCAADGRASSQVRPTREWTPQTVWPS
jgi:hypothetical protein